MSVSTAPLILQRLGRAAATLTPVHRRMAELVRDNLFRSATMSIDEFASAAGASVASANRFAHALGFDGYPAFRAALITGYEATLAPVERLRDAKASSAGPQDILDRALCQAAANIEASRLTLDREACEEIVAGILSARRVFVVGFGASAYLAGLTEHALTPYCSDIQSLALVGGPSHAARRLSAAKSGDLLLAISFPRYTTDSVTLATYARRRGLRVFALTDKPTSPLTAVAERALYVTTQRTLNSTSDAAALAVIEALCDMVAHRLQHSVQAATDLTESVLPWIVAPHA